METNWAKVAEQPCLSGQCPLTLVTSCLPELYHTMSQDQAALATEWLPIIDLLSMGPLSSPFVFACLSLCSCMCKC